LIKALSDGSGTLVGSKDSLAWSGNFTGSLDELVLEVVCLFDHMQKVLLIMN